jgi:hypothetical protein
MIASLRQSRRTFHMRLVNRRAGLRLLRLLTEWYRTENIEDFQKAKRHFLGWCRKAKITLGMKSQTYLDLHRTDAVTKSKAIKSSTTVNLHFRFTALAPALGEPSNAAVRRLALSRTDLETCKVR